MYDLAVIGLGPAGLAAVEIALKNNLKVVAFEKKEPGGTCLNVGCVPTKSILHCAKVFNDIKCASKFGISTGELPSVDWKKITERKDNIVSKFVKSLNTSLAKNLTLVKSEAEIITENNEIIISSDDNFYQAKNVIVATGSIPFELPDLKFDHDFILSSDDMFNLEKLPKSALIVGSGAIGLEWAMILRAFGTDVVIVEKAPSLAPSLDIEIQKRIERILKVSGIKFFKDDFITSISKPEVVLNSGEKITPDLVLVAAGRKPLLDKLIVSGCAEKYSLLVNSDCTTDFENLFVTGDASGGAMLAHSASYQALQVMNRILFKKEFKKKNIPSVVYISPEIASVGLREQDIPDEEKEKYEVKKALLTSVAKSWCDEATDGFLKLILKDDKIKGAHLVSPEASSLITLLEFFIENETPKDEIKSMIFPHPSYSELILEALK